MQAMITVISGTAAAAGGNGARRRPAGRQRGGQGAGQPAAIVDQHNPAPVGRPYLRLAGCRHLAPAGND
jgi:hypothetical protein